MVAAAFEMAPNEVRVVEDQGFAAVLQLTDILPATKDTPSVGALRDAVANNAAGGIAQDVMQLFTAAITSEAGISLDQSVINSVNAQITN